MPRPSVLRDKVTRNWAVQTGTLRIINASIAGWEVSRDICTSLRGRILRGVTFCRSRDQFKIEVNLRIQVFFSSFCFCMARCSESNMAFFSAREKKLLYSETCRKSDERSIPFLTRSEATTTRPIMRRSATLKVAHDSTLDADSQTNGRLEAFEQWSRHEGLVCRPIYA
jgi:hypothetical protein